MAGGDQQTRNIGRPDYGYLVRRTGSQTGPGFDNFGAGQSRCERDGGIEDLAQAFLSGFFIESNIFKGAAGNDAAVRAWNDVTMVGAQDVR